MITITMSKQRMTGTDKGTVALYMCNQGLDCNIISMDSVVKGKLEVGIRLEVFSMLPSQLIAFWKYMQVTLGVDCCWIDYSGYSGCILESPHWKEAHAKTNP
jgi:hypothetical protein